jgi:uncharacterized membrane protein
MPAKPSSNRSPRSDGQIRPGRLLAIQLLILVAMAISAYLAWLSYTGGKAVGCGPDSGCDKVLQSRWAYWLGAPVSLFALAVYSLILGASFRLRPQTSAEAQRKAWAWLVACALVVAGAALWFSGLQIFSLKSICPYCLAAHASAFVAAALLLANAPFRGAPAKPWESERQVYVTPRVLRKVAFLAVMALAGLVAGQVLQVHKTFVVTPMPAGTNLPARVSAVAATNPPPAPPPPVETPPASAQQSPAPARRIFPVHEGRFQLDLHDLPAMAAPTNAQVAVSLFDYTCHHCRSMHPLLVEAQRQFSNSLLIVSLPMPLDPGCNWTVTRHYPSHTNACDYARASLAVWRANRTRHHEFDQWLMTGEKPPSIDETRRHAAQLVGVEAFEKALLDPWVEEQLRLSVGIYEIAYRAGQGAMPQLIVGKNVAVGSYLMSDLMKLLADNLGLAPPPP